MCSHSRIGLPSPPLLHSLRTVVCCCYPCVSWHIALRMQAWQTFLCLLPSHPMTCSSPSWLLLSLFLLFLLLAAAHCSSVQRVPPTPTATTTPTTTRHHRQHPHRSHCPNKDDDTTTTSPLLSPQQLTPSSMVDGAVIWLHGLGDQGSSWSDLEERFKRTYKGNVKFMFPNAPNAPVTCNHGMVMPSWFDLVEIPLTPHSRDSPETIAASVDRVNRWIAQLEAEGIPSERIIIGGFSQGGALTIQTVLRSDKKLAGGVVISGWVLMAKEIDAWMQPVNKDTPFFWGHGAIDPLVVPQMQETGVALLAEKGVSVDSKVYPGVPHGICDAEQRHILKFIANTLGVEEK
ncbi:hypothetical protein PTSG_07562 [Salpingoeca rosetta]|uniref:Phospholipase/carboxylesterase/thioesterase domain-containing protein n=1 Tax=Salpingoeca rosetta (strain ATCC 50818 / BSB-021) TaxID=946362 RepID=F2UH44_SALR5|nr:uncharacterized protein PTSG_07562 [Salpingoeca rosetta]EGD76443.1 hypothetical protein PTSG_07562 [Salpingoeca rosetta]|eukprot:XP_004991358.1 hypothetical protein PTSG_07562 [Salpingoeca rosetta]